MPRAIWTGTLQFVLISFPVKLYKATDSKGISFKTLHNACGSGIKYKKWCDVCGREVQANEFDKGYEIAKGQYVIFKEEEIENALPEATKIIKIEKAIPADEIPVITYEDSYFLAPDKGGEHVYNLLFNALSIKPKVLIGRVVIRSKEHLVAIRPYKDGLLFSMLHFADEVRDIHEIIVIKEKKVDQKELELATNLLDSLTGTFKDINQKDIYREYVETMAEMKAAGQVITIEEKKPVITTGGLIEALKQSIEVSKGIDLSKAVPEKIEIKERIEVKELPKEEVKELHKVEVKELPKEIPIKQQLDQMYGVTEEEIDRLILERKIEDEQERLKILLELQKYKSFEDYVKDEKNKQELEGIETGTDFSTIIIADDKYPRINLPILKKIGIVADHFGILIYIKSSKKRVVPKVKDDDILKLF